VPFYIGAAAVFLGIVVLATAHGLVNRAHVEGAPDDRKVIEAVEGEMT
jgi:hypothetical protein